MPDSPRGLVLSIDRFVGEDGPGIRTTVFLKGCPLRCVWCHSPESISPAPQLLFTANRCISCGACVEACPLDAQIVSPTERRVLWERCDDCGDCVPGWPSTALEMAGKSMSVEQVMDVVERDLVYYRNSGGGATFCGGEPTMQHEFLMACLEACKDAGIHTALDTCGKQVCSAGRAAGRSNPHTCRGKDSSGSQLFTLDCLGSWSGLSRRCGLCPYRWGRQCHCGGQPAQ